MVEYWSANAEATGSNTVEAPKSFLALISQLLKLRYNCDDHLYFRSSPYSMNSLRLQEVKIVQHRRIGHFHDGVIDYNYQNPSVWCFLMLTGAIVI